MDSDIDEDLYGDLEVSGFQESVLKAAEAQERLEELSAVVEKLKSDNEGLVQENNVLKKNLQSLLKTASHEIQRKDKELETLQKTSLDIRTRLNVHKRPSNGIIAPSGQPKRESRKCLVEKSELAELFCCDPTNAPRSDEHPRGNTGKDPLQERLGRLPTAKETTQEKHVHKDKGSMLERLSKIADYSLENNEARPRRSNERRSYGHDRGRQRDYNLRKERHKIDRSRDSYRRRSKSRSRSPPRHQRQRRLRSRSRSPVRHNSWNSNDGGRSRSPCNSRYRTQPRKRADRSREIRGRRNFRGESSKSISPRRHHEFNEDFDPREQYIERDYVKGSPESAFEEYCIEQESHEFSGHQSPAMSFEDDVVENGVESTKEDGERSDSDTFEDALDEQPNTDWQMSFRNQRTRHPSVKTLFTIRMEEKWKKEQAMLLAAQSNNSSEPDSTSAQTVEKNKPSRKEVAENAAIEQIDSSAKPVISDNSPEQLDSSVAKSNGSATSDTIDSSLKSISSESTPMEVVPAVDEDEKEEGEIDETLQPEVSSPLKACYKLLTLSPVKQCVSLLQFHLGKKEINETVAVNDKLTENGELTNGQLEVADTEKRAEGACRQFTVEKPTKPLLPTDIFTAAVSASPVLQVAKEPCNPIAPENANNAAMLSENREIVNSKDCVDDGGDIPKAEFDLFRYKIPKKKSTDPTEKADASEKTVRDDHVEVNYSKRTRTSSSGKKGDQKVIEEVIDRKRTRTTSSDKNGDRKVKEEVNAKKRTNSSDKKCDRKADKSDQSPDSLKGKFKSSPKKNYHKDPPKKENETKRKFNEKVEKPKPEAIKSNRPPSRSKAKVVVEPEKDKKVKNKPIDSKPSLREKTDNEPAKKKPSKTKSSPKTGEVDKKINAGSKTQNCAVNGTHEGKLQSSVEVLRTVPEAKICQKNETTEKSRPKSGDSLKDEKKSVPDIEKVCVENSSQLVVQMEKLPDEELFNLLKLVESPVKMDTSLSDNVITLHGSFENPAAVTSQAPCPETSGSSSAQAEMHSSNSIENYQIFKNVSSDHSAMNGSLRNDLQLSDSESEEAEDSECSPSSDEYDSDASDIVSKLF